MSIRQNNTLNRKFFLYTLLLAIFCLNVSLYAGFSPLASGLTPSTNILRPDYKLVELRPTGFLPNVSGLVWHPDGDLMVAEWSKMGIKRVELRQFNGTIYKLKGVQDAADGTDVTTSIWKDKLEIPTGIIMLGDTAYVTSGFTLDGWVDTDKDGKADALHRVFDFGYEQKCRHEFFMGIVYKAPNFHVTSSRCKDQPGAPVSGIEKNAWQLHKERGAHLLINRFTGAKELISGGLREPYGMGVGPLGDVFECDNQGNWLPGSKLIHMKKGKFYGFYAQNYSLEEDYGIDYKNVKETPPAVWMPHGESSNSPTHPLLVTEGIFKDQMLVGDMAYGGVQRCFIEMVNGDWQGMIIPWSGGFEAGVGAILWGKDGQLIVGGQGIGDQNNWGWLGRRSGLQKMVPIPNAPVVFEPNTVRSRKTGLEVMFTLPLNETEAVKTSNYIIKRYEQNPGPGYGSGNLDKLEIISATSVTLSADKMSVFLELPMTTKVYRAGELKIHTGISVEMKSGLVSATGKSLFVNKFWYTLNSISESKPFDINGCTDSKYAEYNPDANFDDGTCRTASVSIFSKSLENWGNVNMDGGLSVSFTSEGPHAVSVFTVNGKLIATQKGIGQQNYIFNNVTNSNVYMLKIQAGGRVFTKKMMVL